MKKFFLSFFVFLTSAGYVVYQSIGGNAQAPAAPTPPDVSTKNTQVTPSVYPSPAPALPVVAIPKGQYVDGTYVGSLEDAYYGMVQVQAVVRGGRLTAITFLRYPNDHQTSQNINQRAMPQLISEAIQAQSADISGVSGASETSPAFIRSLTTALEQANNS
jgi:uncharacterized protein with FMN-binding domain